MNNHSQNIHKQSVKPEQLLKHQIRTNKKYNALSLRIIVTTLKGESTNAFQIIETCTIRVEYLLKQYFKVQITKYTKRKKYYFFSLKKNKSTTRTISTIIFVK